ncbi:MAG: class I SAM-dependent methyltransferase [Tissierellales bacterium]|jgi:ubiquinone/menaquinone biosynthesis C-methylase UbiE|nr:class I SAM-dependent methyltransferase [Tissierellales bacterium]
MNQDKIKLIELWNKVAFNYGKLGPNYWDKFGERLVNLSHIKEGVYILDIGTGRGATLFPASHRVGINGKIIGIDICENMVDMTNDEIDRQNIKNSKVLQINMEEINFADEYFDNIVSGFSIGYILNNDDYFKNILRVLKKDGQLSFSMWGVQKDQKWLTNIVNEYLKPNKKEEDVVSLKLDSVEGIRKLLEDAKLKEIEIYEEENEVVYLDENQWWDEMWNNAVRGIFESIEKLGQDKFEEFQLKVNNALQNYRRENGICLNMNVIYAVAKK